MQGITALIEAINKAVAWGPFMICLLVGTGIYLTVGMKFSTIRRIPLAFRNLWEGRKSGGEGDISPFNALMTALSAAIGTGNIAGVATAIFLGGPGALFWMWIIAFFGMGTKYAEAVLGVHFREKDFRGQHVGGPMYYIKNGLGPRWKWAATMFAFFATFTGLGMGNTVQSNSIANALNSTFSIPPWATAVVLTVLVGAIMLGGIQRISGFAGKIVPVMGALYVGISLIIIVLNISEVPGAIAQIVTYAFNPVAATGGFAGATVLMAMRFGAARGVLSNGAGLGTSPMIDSAAKTNDPVKQGTIAMVGTFVDTLIICSMTGIIIVMSGMWTSGANGAELSTQAFSHYMPGSEYMIAIVLTLFAFTTITGWSIYGERAAQYLFGDWFIKYYRILWVAMVPVGAVASLEFVWLVADTMNAFMAFPNLVALIMLSPVVFKLTKESLAKEKNKEVVAESQTA